MVEGSLKDSFKWRRAPARRGTEAEGAGDHEILKASLKPRFQLEHSKKGRTRESQVGKASYLVIDVWGALGRPILDYVHRMPIVSTHLLIMGTEGGVCSPTAPQGYP